MAASARYRERFCKGVARRDGNRYSGGTHRSSTSQGFWPDLVFKIFPLEKAVQAKVLRICLIGTLCIAGAIAAPLSHAQRKPRVSVRTPPASQPTPEPASETTPAVTPPADEPQQVETIKINTNLVTVPVIATTASGTYVPDLKQNEFSVLEDGLKQEIAFFATVNAPFHVVLLLDTSASTQEKLHLIQRAAVAFVQQLQTGDRVKVISFDSQVREQSDFTNSRAELEKAIYGTRSGTGTKLYDALDLALSSVRTIQGRKAIVLFTDGVDWHSDEASFDSTMHWLDEEGVIVYPIRYETRAETERIVRGQADDQATQLPTIGVIHSPPSGTTAPTFPSDEPSTVPTSGQARRTGPFGLPLPGEILRRGRGDDPDSARLPPSNRLPPSGEPTDPRDRRSDPRDDRTDRRDRGPDPGPSTRRRRDDDSIGAMLDQLYEKADSYLNELANKSGGRLVRADTLGSLPDAFAKIAAELRTQYAIGYYPANKEHDGKYRKLKVTTTRKDVVLRARPGYRAPAGG